MDEDAHHGEVAMRFAGGVLGVDVVFVVDVLGQVSAGVGYCVEENVLAYLAIHETDCVWISVWRGLV